MYGSPIRDVNHNITISRQPGALCVALFHVFDMFLKSPEFLAYFPTPSNMLFHLPCSSTLQYGSGDVVVVTNRYP